MLITSLVSCYNVMADWCIFCGEIILFLFVRTVGPAFYAELKFGLFYIKVMCICSSLFIFEDITTKMQILKNTHLWIQVVTFLWIMVYTS